MWLQGSRGQQAQANLYRADVTLGGSTAQLVLGRSMSRSCLILQNLGTHAMNIEIGFGAATATLSGTTVASIAVTNAGFNYTKPPLVRILGGGPPGGAPGGLGYNSSYVGLAQPNGYSPSHPAIAHAVLVAGAISSIVVDDPGTGYLIAPYVQILGSDLDPNGAALPSSTSGISLPLSQAVPIAFNGTLCPTDPVSVIGTSGDTLLCRWAD